MHNVHCILCCIIVTIMLYHNRLVLPLYYSYIQLVIWKLKKKKRRFFYLIFFLLLYPHGIYGHSRISNLWVVGMINTSQAIGTEIWFLFGFWVACCGLLVRVWFGELSKLIFETFCDQFLRFLRIMVAKDRWNSTQCTFCQLNISRHSGTNGLMIECSHLTAL